MKGCWLDLHQLSYIKKHTLIRAKAANKRYVKKIYRSSYNWIKHDEELIITAQLTSHELIWQAIINN